MQSRKLACAVALAIGFTPAYALDLYVDTKTKQIFAEPGKNRVKLGTFERVEDKPEAEAAAPVRKSAEALEQSLQKKTEELKAIEARLDKKKESLETGEKQADAHDPNRIETKGKLEWGTADGNFTWRLGGRLHLDGTFYDNDDGTSERSGVDARRARIELQGTLYRHWMWKFDYEFGQTDEVKAGFRDAYIRYLMPGEFPSTLTIGQFKEYFGLEHQNSSNHMPFVERSLVSRVFHDFAEASDGRRLGVGIQSSGHDLWTGAFGVFGKNVSGDSSDGHNDPVALEGRATLSPIHKEGAALHFAFSGNWINLNAPERAEFRARPEARIGAERLIETGVIAGAKDVYRWGMEAGAIYGPTWFQGEYLRTDVNRGNDDSVVLDGWHADVGWVLTGEPRIYDYQQGTFLNPKPRGNVGNGGWGAIELAARYSMLDFNDAGLDGGRESNFTAGANWFLNPNFAFRFSWTKVLDISGGKYDGQTPSEFLMRAQAFW